MKCCFISALAVCALCFVLPPLAFAQGGDSSLPSVAPAVASSPSVEDVVEEGALPEGEAPLTSDVPPPSREVFSDRACDYEVLVGEPVDEETLKATGRPYRLLTPNAAMTMDHNPERVNVEHENGSVTRVWCG